MFRHILPNALAPVLVPITFGIAAAILIESALSFLGFGAPPDRPAAGARCSTPAASNLQLWWLIVFPGMAIFLTVLAYNLIGEGLQEATDPRLRERQESESHVPEHAVSTDPKTCKTYLLHRRRRRQGGRRCLAARFPSGKTLGLVGESGCGKSVTAMSIIRLIASPGRIAGGRIVMHDEWQRADGPLRAARRRDAARSAARGSR